MSLGTILLIVLILMLIGVIPTWPHSRSWGYAPSAAGREAARRCNQLGLTTAMSGAHLV